jgi:hypothetical protein
MQRTTAVASAHLAVPYQGNCLALTCDDADGD